MFQNIISSFKNYHYCIYDSYGSKSESYKEYCYSVLKHMRHVHNDNYNQCWKYSQPTGRMKWMAESYRRGLGKFIEEGEKPYFDNFENVPCCES